MDLDRPWFSLLRSEKNGPKLTDMVSAGFGLAHSERSLRRRVSLRRAMAAKEE
jgi:hypothetical protein